MSLLNRKLRLKQTEELSSFRFRRMEMIGREYIVLRPDNLSVHVKPVRLRTHAICSSSGIKLSPGEYAFKCYENPIRVSPYGPAYISVDEVERLGNDILPQGLIALRIPSYADVVKMHRIRSIDEIRNKRLNLEGIRLLKSQKMEDR